MAQPLRLKLLRLVGVAGIIVACYALYVEYRVVQSQQDGIPFVALCDFGAGSTCSEVLTSESSHLFFGIPNAALGVLFYIACCLYPSFTCIPFRQHMLVGASMGSAGVSVYLATVLIRMRELCAVCITTYCLNAIIFVIAYTEFKANRKSRKAAIE